MACALSLSTKLTRPQRKQCLVWSWKLRVTWHVCQSDCDRYVILRCYDVLVLTQQSSCHEDPDRHHVLTLAKIAKPVLCRLAWVAWWKLLQNTKHSAHLLCSEQYIEDYRGESVCQDDIIIVDLGHSICDKHIVGKDNFLLDVGVDLLDQLLLSIYFMSSWVNLADLLDQEKCQCPHVHMHYVTYTPCRQGHEVAFK